MTYLRRRNTRTQKGSLPLLVLMQPGVHLVLLVTVLTLLSVAQPLSRANWMAEPTVYAAKDVGHSFQLLLILNMSRFSTFAHSLISWHKLLHHILAAHELGTLTLRINDLIRNKL